LRDAPQHPFGSRDQGMRPNPKTSRASTARTALRLVLLSDTHQLHREVEVPNGDIFIHAGDFTMFSESLEAVADFNDWLGELPHRYKIVVPGNHEFFLEADPSDRFMLDKAIVLINEGTEIEGLRIWGSPVTPLYGGAFGLSSPKGSQKAVCSDSPGHRCSDQPWAALRHPRHRTHFWSARRVSRAIACGDAGTANASCFWTYPYRLRSLPNRTHDVCKRVAARASRRPGQSPICFRDDQKMKACLAIVPKQAGSCRIPASPLRF
jgi:hypothetical protein